jgi:uncharacterized protein (TIGR02452 family)
MAQQKAKKNVDIWLDTLNFCKKYQTEWEEAIEYSYIQTDFGYVFRDNDYVEIKLNSPQAHFAKVLTENVDPNMPYAKPATIFVENVDSFDMARSMALRTKTKPLVLNLASYEHAGGGVEHGATAQEEDLFRKSNYIISMLNVSYPLSMDKVVYSPTVSILKDSNYEYLQKPVNVSCLAVAAIKFPKKSISGDFADDGEWLITFKKIEMIFKVAMLHGHTSLVLGALGCGVYQNPPKVIANMFKLIIESYKYCFKEIGFAVLSGNGNPNYDIFKACFD